MAARILHVVTNVAHYDDVSHPTGLWLSELTHAWEVFEAQGFQQRIVSPSGGPSPLEPRSLKFPNSDRTARRWLQDPARADLLQQTLAPTDVDPKDFDAVYFTGGHAVMYDFTTAAELQEITRDIWETGGVVSSVCHGYCGLLNTRLSDGSLLIADRRMTGFSWREEQLARVASLVPYNAQAAAIERGARYEKARIPFASYVVTDGRLVTGQNPGSARATAMGVVDAIAAAGLGEAR